MCLVRRKRQADADEELLPPPQLVVRPREADLGDVGRRGGALRGHKLQLAEAADEGGLVAGRNAPRVLADPLGEAAAVALREEVAEAAAGEAEALLEAPRGAVDAQRLAGEDFDDELVPVALRPRGPPAAPAAPRARAPRANSAAGRLPRLMRHAGGDALLQHCGRALAARIGVLPQPHEVVHPADDGLVGHVVEHRGDGVADGVPQAHRHHRRHEGALTDARVATGDDLLEALGVLGRGEELPQGPAHERRARAVHEHARQPAVVLFHGEALVQLDDGVAHHPQQRRDGGALAGARAELHLPAHALVDQAGYEEHDRDLQDVCQPLQSDHLAHGQVAVRRHGGEQGENERQRVNEVRDHEDTEAHAQKTSGDGAVQRLRLPDGHQRAGLDKQRACVQKHREQGEQVPRHQRPAVHQPRQ
mmetsp:Transcript_117394/g.326408  ORF Transcript_117394/g.326408 Transcript_117394/m.326408 type:complete len:420 (-) Transcript_117394:3-1262(-)